MTDLIAKHGGYRDLKSFQMAEIVYDLTFEFINRYVTFYKDKEQMEGAARGGKQNIAEGSETSATSKQSEIRLVTVAKASQEELKLDYEDFLRKNHLALWGKDDPRSVKIRKLCYEPNKSYKTYMSYLSDAELAANCVLTLVYQTKYLLDQQLRALDKDLVRNGDFKDRYKEIKKKQMFGSKEDDKEFLKQFGVKFDKNGLVIYDDKDKPKEK